MRSIIDIVDLTVEEIDSLIDVALDIKSNPLKYNEKCKGKKLATLFFEPSTRTRLSFESAMIRKILVPYSLTHSTSTISKSKALALSIAISFTFVII
jgi:aspartate carbamoyltransferase catalytic subunit